MSSTADGKDNTKVLVISIVSLFMSLVLWGFAVWDRLFPRPDVYIAQGHKVRLVVAEVIPPRVDAEFTLSLSNDGNEHEIIQQVKLEFLVWANGSDREPERLNPILDHWSLRSGDGTQIHNIAIPKDDYKETECPSLR